MEIDDEPIYRLNKFEMVPEEIESQYPFLHRQDLEVKEEFLEEEIGLCTNLDNFIELKYSEKTGTKDKSALHHLKFDMIKSEKASSEEIFESKLWTSHCHSYQDNNYKKTFIYESHQGQISNHTITTIQPSRILRKRRPSNPSHQSPANFKWQKRRIYQSSMPLTPKNSRKLQIWSVNEQHRITFLS